MSTTQENAQYMKAYIHDIKKYGVPEALLLGIMMDHCLHHYSDWHEKNVNPENFKINSKDGKWYVWNWTSIARFRKTYFGDSLCLSTINRIIRELESCGALITNVESIGHMRITWFTLPKFQVDENKNLIDQSTDSPAIEITPSVSQEPKTIKTSGYSEAFEAFWTAYPNIVHKKAKRYVSDYWDKMKFKPEIIQQIMVSLEAHKKSTYWKEKISQENGKYVHAPLTFLKKQMWEDELPKPDRNHTLQGETKVTYYDNTETVERLKREREAKRLAASHK